MKYIYGGDRIPKAVHEKLGAQNYRHFDCRNHKQKDVSFCSGLDEIIFLCTKSNHLVHNTIKKRAKKHKIRFTPIRCFNQLVLRS